MRCYFCGAAGDYYGPNPKNKEQSVMFCEWCYEDLVSEE